MGSFVGVLTALVDNFTGSNGTNLDAHVATPGGFSWTNIVGIPMVIQSNAARTTDGTQSAMRANISLPSPDYQAEAFVVFSSLIGISDDGDISVRSNLIDLGGYAAVFIRSGGGTIQTQLARVSGGGGYTALTSLYETGVSATTGVTLGIRATGTLLELLVNGIAVDSATDATYTAVGVPGIRNRGGGTGQTHSSDNFTVSYAASPSEANTTTWTLPYAVAVDGSEGTVQVVVPVAGVDTVIATTRPTPTTVRATGNYSASAATIGISYAFEAVLSTLYMRDREGKAETRGRTQVRSITPAFGDTTSFSVEVVNDGRAPRITSISFVGVTDGEKRVPVQAENEQALITIKNTTPFPSRITGLDWEGFYHTRSQRV